jgi:hypothetical protein
MVGKTYLAASRGNVFAGARRRWAGMTASRESEDKTGYLCVIRLMHTSSKHHLMQSSKYAIFHSLIMERLRRIIRFELLRRLDPVS